MASVACVVIDAGVLCRRSRGARPPIEDRFRDRTAESL